MATQAHMPLQRPEPEPSVWGRVHWTVYPLVLAVFVLPLLPWALAAAIATPWFVSRHGRVINEAPWLHAPLTDLLPAPVVWALLVAFALTLALSWGAAVRIVADAILDHPRRMGPALRQSLMRLPLTLGAFTFTTLVVYAVDAGLVQLFDDPHPVLRYTVGALLFLVAAPLWYPLAGVHITERNLEFVTHMRGWALLTRRAALVPVAIVPVAGLAVVLAGVQGRGPAGVLLSATLIVCALTAAAVALTLAAVSPEPDQAPPRYQTPTVLALAVALLGAFSLPTALYDQLLDNGPWPTLTYSQESLEGWDEDERWDKQPLLLPTDGASIIVGGQEHLCHGQRCSSNDEESTSSDQPRNDYGRMLAVTGVGDGALYTFRLPAPHEGYPPGRILFQRQCLEGARCQENNWFLESAIEVEGQWNTEFTDPAKQRNTWDWRSHVTAWGASAGNHQRVLIAMPTADFTQTVLTLVGCLAPRCASVASTPLDRLDGTELTARKPSEHELSQLVDIAVTGDGATRITVHQPSSGALTLYSCADNRCADPVETVIVAPSTNPRPQFHDPENYTGASVEVRPDGTPVIVYRDTADGSVDLVDCADSVCADFTTVEITGPGWQRTPPALALDSQGLPQIATFDVTTRELVYLACADPVCADHSRVVLDTYDTRPGWVALRLDAQDRPHLVWHRVAEEEEDGTVEAARCATPYCAG